MAIRWSFSSSKCRKEFPIFNRLSLHIQEIITTMQCFNYNFIEKYIFRAKFGVCSVYFVTFSVYFVTFHSHVIVYIHLDLIWNNLSSPPYHVLPPLIQPYSMDKYIYIYMCMCVCPYIVYIVSLWWLTHWPLGDMVVAILECNPRTQVTYRLYSWVLLVKVHSGKWYRTPSWNVSIVLYNDLVTSGNRPLPDPDVCHHMLSLCHSV